MREFSLVLVACIAGAAFTASSQAQPAFAQGTVVATVPSQQNYLQKEGDRISNEARRIAGEASRLRAEAVRLTGEEKRLLVQAANLDAEWLKAKEAMPDVVQDYPGRDRSQNIMRADANRIALEVKRLEANAQQLDLEGKRLNQLAADVFELMKKLGTSGGGARDPRGSLSDLKTQIRVMARALSIKWEPA